MLVALFAWAALATDAEVYLASDSNGQNRVTIIQEGDQVWIVVYDPDENIDCDVRDKIWTDIKIMDPKTGAYIIWDSYYKSDCSTKGYKGKDGCTTVGDYLEETDADTGRFVSNHAFQVGSREDYTTKQKNTHVVDDTSTPDEFKWGNYLYTADNIVSGAYSSAPGDDRCWFDADHDANNAVTVANTPTGSAVFPYVASYTRQGGNNYLIGRFENMDSLIVMYVDPNDTSDVAVGMGKIKDDEARISWDQEVYKDANGSATVTVVDPDENLNCNVVEYVPVFVIVNPGSWNPLQTRSATNFCMLKRFGGVKEDNDNAGSLLRPIRWYNIYNSALAITSLGGSTQPIVAGSYFIEYPNVAATQTPSCVFDTDSTTGVTRVMFYAQETGVNTGVFEWKLNSILTDLGFNSLKVHDVLVAYYLDPNDFDDFKLATAYIEERQHSLTAFTDATRNAKSEYWIGRDPVYVEVIDQNANVDPCCPEQVVVHICDPHEEDDSEFVILDETSSNSPVFFTNAGLQLLPVWDALGVGILTWNGGYQLQLDNWKFEVFNEDSVYARYNDVYYTDAAMGRLGDLNSTFANAEFPPTIRQIRVCNDVSFDLMEIADTQVFDGMNTQMYFLDRLGNRVSGYVNSDCVFVEVVDHDQDEDQYRRERIDAYWDKISGSLERGQNVPFGPQSTAYFECTIKGTQTNSINALLGSVNIADTTDDTNIDHAWGKLYVLNPRNGRWAATDLMENGVASGDFVSVICIDLVSQYPCLPTLGVLPGDTIVAVYQDPSNHSDSAWISIKVGIGGGGVPPGQASSTDFVDSEGNPVTTYTDADDAYVKVIDPSHAGADTLTGLEVEGIAYDLSYLEGANTDTFITEAIPMADLGAVAGDEITANYTDATDPLDTSTDTVPIISSELVFESFIAKPNPFSDEVTFTFEGAGIPTTFAVTVYNMSGHLVWSEELANATEIVWDGQNEAGMPLANGPYIYVAMITDGTDTYTGKGKVFINK